MSKEARELLEFIRQRLTPVFQKYNVERALIFGSLARGEPSRRSDVDLIIIQQTHKRFLDRYEGILWDITEALPGWEVDLLIYTPEELERIADTPFFRRVLAESKVIYEREQESLPG